MRGWHGWHGGKKRNSTAWKMKLTLSLALALLLTSCAWKGSASDSSANASGLYDPPTVTTIPGEVYRFAEGDLVGRGEKWHSDYSYRRAIIIGK